MALESSDWDILDETCLSLFDFVWLCWGISINMLTCFFWFVWLFVLSPKRCFLRRISGWNFRLYLIFSVAIESMGHAHPEQLHLKFGARFLSYESFAQNMTIQYHAIEVVYFLKIGDNSKWNPNQFSSIPAVSSSMAGMFCHKLARPMRATGG